MQNTHDISRVYDTQNTHDTQTSCDTQNTHDISNEITLPGATTRATFSKYVCASERVKLIGTIDARFPDFGHHQEKEMGGLWLHPIKLLDGFWLRFHDKTATEDVNCWIIADEYEVKPWGNRFKFGQNLGHTRVKITQTQLCPEEATGLVVSYQLTNHGQTPAEIELEFLARTDMRPVWFSEKAGICKEGVDDLVTAAYTPHQPANHIPLLVKAAKHPWYTAIGSDIPGSDIKEIKTGQHRGPENNHGDGLSISIIVSQTLQPSESKVITFFIAGSYESEDDCRKQYQILSGEPNAKTNNNPLTAFKASKKARYKQILSQSNLQTQDPTFDDAYNWVKIHTHWLTMDAGHHGRGLAAGFPEYPWWFGCDNCYAIQGLLAIGDFKLPHDTLLLLLEYSEKHNGNGQILHEITTAGVNAHSGNTQETAHYIVALWFYYEWTGDLSLVRRAFPYLQKSVNWLVSMDPEGYGFPGGYGITEIAGLNSRLIDTAVYTAAAFEYYAKICEIMANRLDDDNYHTNLNATSAELKAASAEFSARGTDMRDAINTKMWNDKHSLYADVFTDAEEVHKKSKEMLAQVSGHRAEKLKMILSEAAAEAGTNTTKTGWLLNRNWVIITPMEMGIAPKEKAKPALENMHRQEFVGKYGAYLSGGYQDATMTISTGVYATAQARYGYPDRALSLLEKMFSTINMISPGCIAEMSPDYGCFIQGWTVYAAALPVVRYFFGIQPGFTQACEQAYVHELILAPNPPKAWRKAKLSQVLVLDGEVSIGFVRYPSKNAANNQAENSHEHITTYTGTINLTSPTKWLLRKGQTAIINGMKYTAEKEKLIPLGIGAFEISLFER